MKIDLHVVMVFVLKFGDHRRWSENGVRAVHAPPLRAARGGAWRRVRCPLVARFGPKIIIFDYGHVGVCFV
jgi:hypothetical protein